MSDGSRDATFCASFGLREILSASGLDTTGVVPVPVVDVEVDVESLVVLPVPLLVLVSVDPAVVPLLVEVVEYFEAFASALALFASVFVLLASTLVVFASAFAVLAVVFVALTSTLVAGFVDVVVGAPDLPDLIELPLCELPCPDVDVITGALAGFVVAGFVGLTPFGPATSLA